MQSVLSRVTKKDIIWEPFPHIVKENALEESLCDELIAQYPKLDVLTKGITLEQNTRFSFSSKDVRESSAISDLWKEFIALHVSKSFYDEFMDLFGDYLDNLYPDFVKESGSFKSLAVGTLNEDSYDEKVTLLSSYIAGNTPVTETSTVKIAHIDNINKFLTGLLYLRKPDDDSKGGNLEIFETRGDGFRIHGQRFIKDKYLTKIKTVLYKPNTLILFPSSKIAIHGVTPRKPTQHLRQFVNLVGQVEKPLFSLDDSKENLFQRVYRKAKSSIL